MAWCGDEDLDLPDNAAPAAAVTRLEGLRLTAMEDLFEAEVSVGHGAKLIVELTDAVAAHPLRERLAAALMRALAAAGRETEALLVVRAHEGGPRRRPGRQPLTGAVVTARSAAAGRAGDGQRRTRVPTCVPSSTTFVGRDADVEAVRELIGEHRLTTLTGPVARGRPGWPRSPLSPCSATCPTEPGWWSSQPSAPTGTWRRRHSPGSASGTRSCWRGTQRGAHRPAHRRDPRPGGTADPGQL